jgi:hypothetical protein
LLVNEEHSLVEDIQVHLQDLRVPEDVAHVVLFLLLRV